MSYTINPNAKNKWARNAENTMDLSLETDASSVYLDNGRTLEQEIGEGSMVSNVATVDNAMSKVIDGTLDGAYESLVFKGKSLVNLCPNKVINYTAASDWDGFNALCQNSATQESWRVLQDLKPNTKYFVSCYVETFNVGEGQCYLLNNRNDSTVFAEPLEVRATGLHKWTLTSKSEFTEEVYVALRCQNKNARGTIKIRDIMIIEYQEGMENWDISCFAGLCDVKMPILRNVGKNLSDGKLETGRYTQAEGEKFTDASAVRTINKIKVKPSTKYCLRTMDGTTIYNISEYHDGTYIGYKASGSSLVFTTSPTTNGLHISFKTNNINLQYQLEEGSIATTYEDHKTNILRTSEEIVLREVNEVQDTYNPLTGEYVQRIGEIILDGSESWVVDKNYEAESHICYKTVIPNINDGDSVFNVLCDKFPTQTGSNLWSKDLLGISGSNANVTNGKGIKLSVRKSDLNSLTTDGLKEFLSQNPTTVQYQLESPIIAKVDLSAVPFAYENGHVILESGFEGQSLLPTLEYSTVVNKTGQIESVAKVIQKQEKQLTMLEQMLIQNIINLDYNNTLLTLKNEMEEML